MSNKAKCFELRTNEGKVILSLYLYEKELQKGAYPEESVEKLKPEEKKEQEKQSSPQSNDNQMTLAQKKYLFRILAEKGMEAEKAHEQLKAHFQVESLADVTKKEASKMIEKLLEDDKGGTDDPIPF